MNKSIMLQKWAPQLSEKLNRSAQEIMDNGIICSDFRAQVEIKFQDQSHALFHYAFFVVNKETRECAIFTEHCGYFEFPVFGASLKEVYENYFVDEHYEEL